MFDLPPDALGPKEIGGKKKSNSGNENKIEGKGKFCCEIIDRNGCKALILPWTTFHTVNPACSITDS